jgi:hypothetical protein
MQLIDFILIQIEFIQLAMQLKAHLSNFEAISGRWKVKACPRPLPEDDCWLLQGELSGISDRMHKRNELRNYSSGAQQRRVQAQLIISPSRTHF